MDGESEPMRYDVKLSFGPLLSSSSSSSSSSSNSNSSNGGASGAAATSDMSCIEVMVQGVIAEQSENIPQDRTSSSAVAANSKNSRDVSMT